MKNIVITAVAIVAAVAASSSAAQETGEKFDRRHVEKTFKQQPTAAEAVEPGQGALNVPVQFEFGSARLSPQSTGTLDVVAAVMNDPAFIARTFIVEGHTDSVGDAATNQKLSVRRAEAVRDYLVSRSVAPGRLKAAGYGETRPLPGIPTTDGLNRRVLVVREF